MQNLPKYSLPSPKAFITVVKPGIVISNVLVAIGAFIFGAAEGLDYGVPAGLIVGTACVIAGSCVINNYFDRDIDVHMLRTARRPSVTGALPLKWAIPYSAILLGVGFIVLLLFTNLATTLVGLIGAVWYALVYTFSKRHTPWSTLIGTVSGATPPLAGYLAATNSFDITAWLLFGVLVAWQMPHFYAIALFRVKDYAAAKIPVMPLVWGIERTVWQMRVFLAAYLALVTSLVLWSDLHYVPGIVLVGLGGYWLGVVSRPNWRQDSAAWARKVFFTSLWMLPVLAICLASNRWWS